jgi:hypothetical protein
MRRTPYQSKLVKTWNFFADHFRLQRACAPKFSVEALLSAARRATGLYDFGDPSFLHPLRVFLQSLDESGDLHHFGRFSMKKFLLMILTDRLRLVELWKKHPEILRRSVKKPIIILGLPRTGTSLLVNLLAQDPAHRCLANWETTASPLPPKKIGRREDDPRRRLDKFYLRFMDYLAPHFKNIHEFHLDGPEECTPILFHEFVAQALALTFNVPAYSRWLNNASHAAAYRHHKRVLQTLQWTYPGKRWLLKAPGHIAALDDLLVVYPDACLVQTHRDPVKAVTSWASLNTAFRGIYARAVDQEETGRQTLDRLDADLNKFLRDRRRHEAQRLFDIQYRDLVRDPLAEVRRLYAHFALPLSAEPEERMRSFLVKDREERKERSGHQYAPEDFGLTAAGIRERFQKYVAEYELAPQEREKAKAADGVRRDEAAMEVVTGREISRVG